MQLIGFKDGEITRIGRLHGDKVAPLSAVEVFFSDIDAGLASAETTPASLALADLILKPAAPASARVPCIGLNYRAHAAEGNLPIPEHPVVFGRYAASLACHGDPVPLIDPKTDWEGELAIIIGRPVFQADEVEAAEAVLGYAAFNDISARTYQFESSQWTMGKNGDGSGILGPIVTRDEAGDPGRGLRLQTRVNGEVVQDTSTSDMIFPVARIVSYLSKAMRLNPGDVIPTGTPSGVGVARTPARFLGEGDLVEVEIERLGRIANRMTAVTGRRPPEG